jgi:hypothetical protein
LKPKNTYNKPCFETAYLGENVINLLQQKAAQNVTFSLVYFIFKKNHNKSPKIAQLAKNCPIWSFCQLSKLVTLCCARSLTSLSLKPLNIKDTK